MVKFKLNGRDVEIEEGRTLINYLREECDLTSVKNGCGEGACGACMVLVDGKATKACILKSDKIEGKEIQTVEGLSDRDKKVFAYAFSKAGAVQCGFCIPGMVISAKALLLKTLNPTLDEVKKALMGNICRCTGYVKIEKAVLMAAEILRENRDVPTVFCKGIVGEEMGRIDAEDKILAEGEYVDDMKINGMIYGFALRSKYPRALVKNIDYSDAEKLEGVVKVVTSKDILASAYRSRRRN